MSGIKADIELKLDSFCLMSNHAHLLMHEKTQGDLVMAMRKLLGPYAYWFNRKYKHSGALIANRYKANVSKKTATCLPLSAASTKTP